MVAQRDGECIRNICRFRGSSQAKFMADRILHLFFWCSPVPGKDLFDLGRGVVEDRDLVLAGCQAVGKLSILILLVLSLASQ